MPDDFDLMLNKYMEDPEFKKHYIRERLKLEVGFQLSKLRKKRKLSQAELAEKLNTTQSVIARIENGNQNLSLKTVENIVNALDGKLQVTIGV